MNEPQQAPVRRSFDLNMVTIAGRVGFAELKQLDKTSVLNFTVAVAEMSGDKEYTTWVRCTAWGKYAEYAAPRVTKGARVMVAGKLRSREFEQQGQKREVLELMAEKIATEPTREQAQAQAQRAPAPAPAPAAYDDDIPY